MGVNDLSAGGEDKFRSAEALGPLFWQYPVENMNCESWKLWLKGCCHYWTQKYCTLPSVVFSGKSNALAVALGCFKSGITVTGETRVAASWFAHTLDGHLFALQLILHRAQVLLQSDTVKAALCFCLESIDVLIGFGMYRTCCKEKCSQIVHVPLVT